MEIRMRVLIVSDTHKRNDNFFKVIEKEKPFDMVIHCGDIEGSEYAISSAVSCPVEMVAGNNDFFSQLSMDREFMVGRYHVWVTHGHNYYVSLGIDVLKSEARARGADMVFFGHTHRPLLDLDGGVIAVNPGSLSYPRQEGREPSYVVLELNEDGGADFSLRYLQG